MERITIALIEDIGWSLDSVAMQLLQWGYRILPVRPWALRLDLHGIQTAAIILTLRTKWEIERIMNRTDHPPVITTDDFDLMLRNRIENYLRGAGLNPPA
jgi:predicted CoA-binding protein